jgi:putative aminopeptidase FrvX
MTSTALALAALGLFAPPVAPLLAPPSDPPLADFARTPAPVGHEQLFLDEIAALLPPGLTTERDAFGSLIVRCGDGAPTNLLIAVGVDEPGFVVSQIREDGYLRVRTLGARNPPGDFHLLREGRPARVWSRDGVRAAVMLVDSVHLRSVRPATLGEEHLYLDVGADSPAGVEALGIELLDPVVQREVVALIGGAVVAPAVGRRAAALVMLRALRDVPEVAASSGLAFAFVAQSTVGAGPLGRGGEGVLRRLAPDEMLVLRGAEGLDAPVRRDASLTEAQGSQWRPLELRVAHAHTPVELVRPDDVESLLKALLDEVVYGEVRADETAAREAPDQQPQDAGGQHP